MLSRLTLVTCCIPILFACQSYSPTDYSQPYNVPSTGSQIELHQPLTVAAGTTRAFIQYGEMKMLHQINQRAPWCQFYLNQHPRDIQQSRTINPDRFTIVNSYQQAQLAGLNGSLRVAASSLNFDSLSSQVLATVMKLQSDKQPQVVELKCAIFDDPLAYNFVSVDEIRKALGQIVTINDQNN